MAGMNLFKYTRLKSTGVCNVHPLHLPLGGCWRIFIHQVTDFLFTLGASGKKKKRRKCQAGKFKAIKENQSWLVLSCQGQGGEACRWEPP